SQLLAATPRGTARHGPNNWVPIWAPNVSACVGEFHLRDGSPSSFLSPALYRRHVVALGGPYGHHNPSDHRRHTVASRWRLVRPRPVVLGHSTYISVMLQRERSSRGRPLNAPAAFIHPCQPIVAKQPPMGPGWAHELKHDGYRLQHCGKS